ncbi:MAG: ABC transporter substrate-binding protein [Bryobacteraceae bacterium]
MARIISLISSATEIVNALGALPLLVGRSHECDYPERVLKLPVCTRPRFPVNGDSREIDSLVRQTLTDYVSVYEVFDHVLERLQPTHILTQVQCQVCAVSLEDVERSVATRLSSRPKIVSLSPFTLPDVWEDIRRVAESLDIAAKGESVVGELQKRMLEISRAACSNAVRPRIACIEWLEPILPAANWMPELVEMAGGEIARWRTWKELVALDPDVILVMPCGFSLRRSLHEMHWLTDRPGWRELRAVRNARVYAADGNQYLNRPGPRLVESLQILAEIMHPQVFPPRLDGTGWKTA